CLVDETRASLAEIARELFQPFFVHHLTTSPAWFSGSVKVLARAAYDERHLPSGELDLHRLAVLADALEDAGAPDEIVAHLRGPGPHVRGCHVIDLCLDLR